MALKPQRPVAPRRLLARDGEANPLRAGNAPVRRDGVWSRRNVVRNLRRVKERKAERRAKGKLKVGVDILFHHSAAATPRAATVPDRDLLRPSFRTARPALDRCELRCQSVHVRSLQHRRPAEVRIRRKNSTGASVGSECTA